MHKLALALLLLRHRQPLLLHRLTSKARQSSVLPSSPHSRQSASDSPAGSSTVWRACDASAGVLQQSTPWVNSGSSPGMHWCSSSSSSC